MSIRILICDDQETARAGIRLSLEAAADIQVVGEADSSQAAYDLAEYLHPDVVLMDVVVPGENGVSMARKILEGKGSPRVLAVSMHTDLTYVRAMKAAGASGYVDKSCAYEELAFAIREVMAGRDYLSPSLTMRMTSDVPPRKVQVAGGLEMEIAVPIAWAKEVGD